LLHLVGSSILLYLIDDARSNKNQVYRIGVEYYVDRYLIAGSWLVRNVVLYIGFSN